MEAKKQAEELIKQFGDKDKAISCAKNIIEAVMTGYLLIDAKVALFQKEVADHWNKVIEEIKIDDIKRKF